MTRAERLAAAAASAVAAWPSLTAAQREATMTGDIALITPYGGQVELSWRGHDRIFGDLFAALSETDALGIPRDRVKVLPFEPTPLVLAELPALP